MPPKVDRELKYKSCAVAPPEHNYMNYGFHAPQRPQHLPLVKTLPGNHYVGAFPNQTDRWSSGPLDDADYLPMQPPTRSETTRCYSFTKEEKPGSRAVDQCYEDMSALQTRRHSGGKSSSSSTSSLADNDDLYMAMGPSQVSTVTKSTSLGTHLKMCRAKRDKAVLSFHNSREMITWQGFTLRMGLILPRIPGMHPFKS